MQKNLCPMLFTSSTEQLPSCHGIHSTEQCAIQCATGCCSLTVLHLVGFHWSTELSSSSSKYATIGDSTTLARARSSLLSVSNHCARSFCSRLRLAPTGTSSTDGFRSWYCWCVWHCDSNVVNTGLPWYHLFRLLPSGARSLISSFLQSVQKTKSVRLSY